MFQLTVVFGNPTTSWSLLFNTQEAAETSILALIANTTSRITDDFGQCYIPVAQVSGFMLEDLDVSANAKITLHLHSLKTQDLTIEAIKADPKLVAISRMIQSLQNAGPAASRLVMPLGAIPRT